MSDGNNPAGRALVPYDRDRHQRDETTVNRGFWTKTRRVLGHVPFVEEAASAYFCATDAATPTSVKAMLMAALAYFVVPGDMIPDFIVGLGFSDDATVLLATISLVSSHMKARHRHRARRALQRLGLKPGVAANGQPPGAAG